LIRIFYMKILYICALSMAVQSLFCMDKEVSPVSSVLVEHKFPGIAYLRGIGVVRENVIAAIGEKNVCVRHDIFFVYDIEKQECVIRENNDTLRQMYDFAIHKSGKYVALSQEECLTVFNVPEKKIEWKHNKCRLPSIAFCPMDIPQVVFHDINKDKLLLYNQSGKQEVDMADVGIQMYFLYSPFAHHPTKKEILIDTGNGYGRYDYHEKKIIQEQKDMFKRTVCKKGQCYNGDGSCIAVMVEDKEDSCVALISSDYSVNMLVLKDRTYLAMKLHPNNKILLLLTHDNIIECWDYKQKKCIHSIDNLKNPYGCGEVLLSKKLDISHDGKKLFVISPTLGGFVEIILSDEIRYAMKNEQIGRAHV